VRFVEEVEDIDRLDVGVNGAKGGAALDAEVVASSVDDGDGELGLVNVLEGRYEVNGVL
jgi:hypothetical protein